METVNKYLSSIDRLPNSKKLILVLIVVVVVMLGIEIYSSKSLRTNVVNHSDKIEKLMNANGSLEKYHDDEEDEEDEDEEDEEDNQAKAKPSSAKKIKLSADKLNVTLFYAHWCGHCKQFLKDSWGKLKEQYDDSDVQLNEVDCTEVKSRIQTPGGNDIEGFPTLVFNYVNASGELQEEEYKGGRTVKHVTTHITKIKKMMSA
jgi:thiol-disulfide isomerase/thioredoxin